MKQSRSLLLSCLLALALVQIAHASAVDGDLLRRQGVTLPPLGGPSTTTGGTTTQADPTTTEETTTEETTTQPTTTDRETTQDTTTDRETTRETTQQTTTNNQSTTQPTSQPETTPPPQTSEQQQQPVTSQSVSTGANGELSTVEVVVTVTGSDSTSAEPSQTSNSSSNSDEEDSGLSTGSIIGLSVAAGVAVLGIVGFFVWKFTRKRFSEFDDNEAIKWPELNAHNANGADSHPLPVHNTGRAGFDTGSEVSLSRAPSTSGNYSTPDLTHNDPYAVPPLPHMNPNQPYRDDPGGAYYDPYRGPVPNTFHDPHAAGGAMSPEYGGGEAIPMTQMAGRMSPGPNMAYGGDPARAMSPNPNVMRAASPGPVAAYGRQSPGPYDAYGAPR